MKEKLKCLLLDDELPGLTYLKMLCDQIPGLEVVKAFNNPQTLLAEAPGLDFDLCILDIEMPEMSGLQVANLLNGKPVIFTTAYKEYAAEAFDLNAIDYVRKPVKMERLHQAVQKAAQRLQTDTRVRQYFQWNTEKGKTLVFFDQLLYVKTSENDSRDKIAYLSDNITFTLKNISFEKLLEMLPSGDFCRINKRELIAIKTVQVFSFDEITLNLADESGQPVRLTLSDIYRQNFLQQLKN